MSVMPVDILSNKTVETDNCTMFISAIYFWTQRIAIVIIFYLWRFFAAVYYFGQGKVVPPVRNPLLLKSAKKLAEEIRNGKLKSEELVQAFIDRIKEVEPYINAVVHECFQEALQQAKEVDLLVQSEVFSKTQLELNKPLLGIPFTVKLLLAVKDCPYNGGSKLFEKDIATEDAPSVSLLRDAGGIFLATTNAPEFGLSFETNNLTYGKTCNPYNTSKTPGGSSGGEAALIAAGASIIGLGNDGGGSIRIPAHFTGIFSHKPSATVIPNSGSLPMLHPDIDYMLNTGPMCRYSEDLVLLTKILSAVKEKHLKLDRKIDFKKLKIYYSTAAGSLSLPVDRDIVKSIKKAASYFTEVHGATAEEINMPILENSSLITLHVFLAPTPNPIKFITSGKVENINYFIEILKWFCGKSNMFLSTLVTLASFKCPVAFQEKNVPHYQRLKRKIQDEFDILLDENSVFLYPTFPITALYHYEASIHLLPSTGFTSIFNLMGLPVTNCPTGFNRDGMPQGIQIISAKNNDALTLACAVELDNVFGGWTPPGGCEKTCHK